MHVDMPSQSRDDYIIEAEMVHINGLPQAYANKNF